MLTKREIPISALMHLIDRRFKQLAIGDVSEYDSTSIVQGQILGHLAFEKNVVPNDICEHFHLSRATVSGVLKRMEKKQFIELIDNPNDKRSKIIRLLPKGEKHNQMILDKFNSTEAILLSGLNDEELSTLRNLLLKLNHNVERSGEVD